jgi:surface protein
MAAFTAYGDIRFWNTSGVTNMDNVFGYDNPHNWYSYFSHYTWRYERAERISWWNENFDADLSQWDTSLVTSMERMFERASSFNSDLSLWNTSQVTNMKLTFNVLGGFQGELGY